MRSPWPWLSCQPPPSRQRAAGRNGRKWSGVEEFRTLIRKSFRVWNNRGLGLEFLWEPRGAVQPGDDFANGAGTLTWHARGAPDYDHRFAYSIFKGTLKDGRPEGEGTLVVLRSGMSYAGHWTDGLMQGRGVLRLANGDTYDGDFANGEMHGNGKYMSADGTVYTGEFRDGLRDGTGILRLDAGSFHTVWRSGKEIERQAIPEPISRPSALRVQKVATSNLVKLRVVLDPDHNVVLSPDYRADVSPGLITIEPASDALLNAWKKSGPLASGADNAPERLESSESFATVALKVEVENQSASVAQIADASLVVARVPDIILRV